MSQTQVKIQPENHLMVGLLGQRDELLRLIEASFDAKPFVRGNEITVEGPDAARVGTLINELVLLLEQGHVLDPANVLVNSLFAEPVRNHTAIEWSFIVAVPWPAPAMRAFAGLCSTTWNHSSMVLVGSARTLTVMVCCVWPGAKVRVPLAGI